MRICHVIESAGGGSAAIMVSLALHGVRHGHQVHVVYSPDRADPAVIEALRIGGCAGVWPTAMRRAITPRDMIDGWTLRRLLDSLGPLDVIHSHSSKAGALARMFTRRRGAAQIYSPHGFYTMTGQAPAYIGAVERALGRLTDRVIAVSECEKRHAIGLGIASDRVTVVANGIAPFRPLARADARERLGIAADAFAIGFVGRLSPQKDPVAAVEAAAALDEGIRPILAVIGDGELREAAEQRSREIGAPAQFHGALQARELISAFDCLLCTSRYEGMPVAFLEALNCGVPIVSFPVGGTEELVEDGATGFVTAADPAAAAAAIARLAAAGPGERETMAAACRKRAAAFSDEVMGSRTLDVYQAARRAGH